MSKLELDIDIYLTEANKREIVTNAFKAEANQRARDDLDRIISNGAYKLVFQAVDAAIDGDVKSIIKDKAIDIISNLTASSVFKRADAWHKGESVAYTYLEEAIKESRDLLFTRVNEVVSKYDENTVKSLIEDNLSDIIAEIIMKGASK
jgi:hypothetical protein